MKYIEPKDVHAPKRHWSLIHVILDGGPGRSALAIGRWENRPVLAMRWNGTDENPLGNPQSRGLPTWFVVPEQHWRQILETEHYGAAKEDALDLARNFLELKRVYFVSRCPNPKCRDFGKLVLLDYRIEEVYDTLNKLDRDELKFYHIICDAFWHPTSEDKARLTRVLSTAWDTYQRGPGFTLTAHLLDNGLIRTEISGLSQGVPQVSPPQHIDMLHSMLNTRPWVPMSEKETFFRDLHANRRAQIFIPRNTAQFFAG